MNRNISEKKGRNKIISIRLIRLLMNKLRKAASRNAPEEDGKERGCLDFGITSCLKQLFYDMLFNMLLSINVVLRRVFDMSC